MSRAPIVEGKAAQGTLCLGHQNLEPSVVQIKKLIKFVLILSALLVIKWSP